MKKTFMAARGKPRRVDFGLHKQDFEAALLGSLGQSTVAISANTQLSKGQVTYRLRKAGVRLGDYRSGESTIARLVMRNMRPVLERELHAHLKQL
jgi:hypothetical protein